MLVFLNIGVSETPPTMENLCKFEIIRALVLKFKGEQGVIQFHFRKIPLHQQKFFLVTVLSNSPWLPRNLKKMFKVKLLSAF